MKNILKLTLVVLLFVSCKDANKSKGMESVMDEIVGNNDAVNEKYNLLLKELGTKTPLTDTQLKEAFPKKLSHLNLDASDDNKVEPRIIDNQLVAGSFGDDTIRVEILDAAAQKAVGAIIPLKMLELNKVTSENNNTIRYTKQKHNGILTFGTDRDENTQADFQSEIRFLFKNRFYVTLEGKKMTTDQLWEAFDINSLKSFK